MRARVAGTIVLVLVATACTSGGNHPEASRGSDLEFARGGTLRAAVPRDSEDVDLDPQSGYSGSTFELDRCCLLRTLYSYNGRPSEQGGAEPRPDLAVGPPEVSADGLTWSFTLRPGLRYAPPFEGTTITALDVVRALERTARVGEYAYYYDVIHGFEDFRKGVADSIAGLEIPDERTLVVRLDQLTGDLVYRFTLPATAPLPEGAADGHDEDYERFLVASGPYMIEGSDRLDPAAPIDQQRPASGFVPSELGEGGSLEPGSLVLVRNPSWHPATDRLRTAYADRIELSLGGLDDEEIAHRVDVGETDLVFLAPSPVEQVEEYRDDPALEDRVFEHRQNGLWALTMNLAVPPFDDVHVRRAVSQAIDKEALVRMLSAPPYGPFGFSFGEVATHEAPDAFEGEVLRAFDPYPYDLAAARAEMQASAYDRSGDGRCDAPACSDVRVLVMDAGVLVEQARAIRENLAEIGIDLTLDIVSPGDFFGDLDLGGRVAGSIHDPGAHNPMGIAYPWLPDYPEGGGWFSLFSHAAIPGPNTSLVSALPGELRRWGYRITSVPSAEERYQGCLERRGVARTECWAELDQYLTTEVVGRVPYMITEHVQVVSERVVGYSFDQFAGLPALDRIALAPGSD
jgi:peptide/nickel transport system substrate-binding protein